MTGAPQYRARELADIPPTTHRDAMLHGYYPRNRAVAEAALGERVPARLRDGVAKLTGMAKGSDLHARLFAFLEAEGPPTARELLAAKEGDVKSLSDGNPATECVLPWPEADAAVAPRIAIDLKLPAEQTVRALDLRIGRGRVKVVVEAWVDGDWKDIYWGQSGTVIHALVPTKTDKLCS